MDEQQQINTHTPHTTTTLRREDPALITGRAKFVDDVRLSTERPALLHMQVVRSPYAHARIDQIDVSTATLAPGVIAVLSGQELAVQVPPLEVFGPPHIKRTERFPLAVAKVRHVGDPVVVVLAENRYQAADARDLVEIDYTPLPALTDVETAAQIDAPLLYEELGTNRAFSTTHSWGNVAEAFQQADHITHLRLVNQRLAPASIENRVCLFDYDAQSGHFYAWVSSQSIFRVKATLARYLSLAPENVHVYNANVGGAFGAKNYLLGEELVAAWLAFKHARPVKWIEDRSENLQAQAQGRGQVDYLEAAYTNDGTLLGLKVHILADIGSFWMSLAFLIANRSAEMLIGPYRIAAIESTVDGFYTNKPPITPYRGAGRPEATYMLERTIEQIARELDLDPAEVRSRNFLPADSFPYHAVTGIVYDSGNYQVLLARLLAMSNYQQWRKRQQAQRLQVSSRLLGLGFATFTEFSGDAITPPHGTPKESALVRVRSDGTLLVQSGIAHNGQGHATILAQVVAEVFEVAPAQVIVEINHTDMPVYSIGTYGSRITQVAISAALLAAQAVHSQALHIASYILEVDPADLELHDGQVTVLGVPGRVLSLGELARQAEAHPELLATDDPPTAAPALTGLAAWRDFAPGAAAWSAGAHLAIVEIDSETGDVELLHYFAVDDCGRVVNEALAEAQLQGSIAQGIGQALFEETVYGEEGQLLSGSLMDYALPLAKQLPSFTSAFIEIPSPTNPLGAKGIGESGTIGAPPAIVNAVLDALAPFGIKAIDMPLRSEKVWKLLQQKV